MPELVSDRCGSDPGANPIEGPSHELHLAPFFISKYEMSQGQWMRFTGHNPSHFAPGRHSTFGEGLSYLLPVEQVSWSDCEHTLSRLGLVIPTEAQWEHAARAGTTTPYWSGRTKETLVGAVNLVDATAIREGTASPMSAADWPDLDDGHARSAPVDAMRPSGYGLHHVYGNVFEWCRDRIASYEYPTSGPDSERIAPLLQLGEPGNRVVRGGGWQNPVHWGRSSARGNTPADTRHFTVGIRPARPLDL